MEETKLEESWLCKAQQPHGGSLTRKEKGFLGYTKFYNPLLCNCSPVAVPLTSLTSTGTVYMDPLSWECLPGLQELLHLSASPGKEVKSSLQKLSQPYNATCVLLSHLLCYKGPMPLNLEYLTFWCCTHSVSFCRCFWWTSMALFLCLSVFKTRDPLTHIPSSGYLDPLPISCLGLDFVTGLSPLEGKTLW